MFFSKKPKVKDPYAELVKCETCKHMIHFADAQEIPLQHSGINIIGATKETYCPTHKKPYDSIFINFDHSRFYYRNMAVRADGTPIGYKKEKID